RAGQFGGGTARVAGKRCKAPQTEHASCRVRAHPALVDLSAMGVGNERQRTGALVFETIWFRHGAEWSHSPNHAQSGRERDISHRDVDGIPAGSAGRRAGAWALESASGEIAKCAWHYGREFHPWAAHAGRYRFTARFGYVSGFTKSKKREEWKDEEQY